MATRSRDNRRQVFLIIASFPDSLIQFRGSLMDSLIDAGKNVHVAVPGLEKDSGVSRVLSGKGICVHDIPLRRTGLNPIQDIKLLLSLIFLIIRLRPHYVIAYTIKPVIYGSIAAWLARVRNRFSLITGLGYTFTETSSAKKLFLLSLVKSLYSFSLKRVHHVFFQNPDDEALFRKLHLLPRATPSSVLNGSGVDINQYTTTPLPEGTPFLLIARLLGSKGVREYAQAAIRLKNQRPDLIFRLVGWVDDTPDAIQQKELDTWIDAGAIEFLGRLEDVRPAIAACSVYVLPSYREGTPRTVLEAMAMGRAVITTDAPGCRETVVDGDNGFLVPVKDVDALAAAMIKMVDTPGLAARMGDRSRRIAEAKYDVHKVNAAMLRGMGIK